MKNTHTHSAATCHHTGYDRHVIHIMYIRDTEREQNENIKIDSINKHTEEKKEKERYSSSSSRYIVSVYIFCLDAPKRNGKH